jgi:hypothetical protein
MFNMRPAFFLLGLIEVRRFGQRLRQMLKGPVVECGQPSSEFEFRPLLLQRVLTPF